MKLNHRLAAAGVAGALAVTGLTAVVVAPLASAARDTATADATDDATARAAGRVQAIADALAGLVGDGTLTQAQADEVATTLAGSDALRGGGGHGGGRGLELTAAAEALGLTADELRTALTADGATLAGVAEAEGVELSALTDALVAAGTERIEAALADGRITQEEADAAIAALPAKVAERVEQELPAGGPRGHGGGPG
ncbi:hypothetical protein AB6N24_05530, partial [Cellulomonas sp. 179-A 4D5 NHS]|uniref:hypothetical protein n=1 Tax=Cellulomonas sp. 179-A 4D5 NHS TaxID=3142378 RepID=UPI0039A041BD